MTSTVTDLNRERAIRDRKDTLPGPQATFRYRLLELIEDHKHLGPEVLLSELTGLCVYVQAMKE